MIVPSLFGDLASRQNLQALIDNSIDSLQSQSIWRQYLDWGIPQWSLTFETVIGRSRLEAAAAITAIDAPAPLRSFGKLEDLTGGIPTMKEKWALNQSDYRALQQLSSLPISAQDQRNALISKLYDAMSIASTSTDRRLDIMFLQAVSTGFIDINTLNNPEGPAFGAIDLLMAADNKRKVVKVWTDPTSDPFKDINDTVVAAGATGRKFKEIWIDNDTWLSMKNLAAVKSAISGYMNPGSNAKFIVTLTIINEYLVSNQMPMLKIVNERRGIIKDGVIQTINPFKKENVVFIPDGKLGIVHNAISIEDREPVTGKTYAKYDRTLVMKWRDDDPWREYTGVELHAFPALEAIDGIFLLQTDIAA